MVSLKMMINPGALYLILLQNRMTNLHLVLAALLQQGQISAEALLELPSSQPNQAFHLPHLMLR